MVGRGGIQGGFALRCRPSCGCSSPSALIRLRVCGLSLPVPRVLRGQILALDDEEVLGHLTLWPALAHSPPVALLAA